MKGFNIHLFIIGRDLGDKDSEGSFHLRIHPEGLLFKNGGIVKTPFFLGADLIKNTFCNGEQRQLGTQAPSFPGKYSIVLKFTSVLDFVS